MVINSYCNYWFMETGILFTYLVVKTVNAMQPSGCEVELRLSLMGEIALHVDLHF